MQWDDETSTKMIRKLREKEILASIFHRNLFGNRGLLLQTCISSHRKRMYFGKDTSNELVYELCGV